MLLKIQKWGNSLAFRIPNAFARKVSLEPGSTVSLDIRGKSLVIKPVREDLLLKDLLSGVKPSNLHSEEDFGLRQGQEAW